MSSKSRTGVKPFQIYTRLGLNKDLEQVWSGFLRKKVLFSEERCKECAPNLYVRYNLTKGKARFNCSINKKGVYHDSDIPLHWKVFCFTGTEYKSVPVLTSLALQVSLICSALSSGHFYRIV